MSIGKCKFDFSSQVICKTFYLLFEPSQGEALKAFEKLPESFTNESLWAYFTFIPRMKFSRRNVLALMSLKTNEGICIIESINFFPFQCVRSTVSSAFPWTVIIRNAMTLFTTTSHQQFLRAHVSCFRRFLYTRYCESEYLISGMGGRKGRDGLFPATSCIKIAGYFGELKKKFSTKVLIKISFKTTTKKPSQFGAVLLIQALWRRTRKSFGWATAENFTTKTGLRIYWFSHDERLTFVCFFLDMFMDVCNRAATLRVAITLIEHFPPTRNYFCRQSSHWFSNVSKVEANKFKAILYTPKKVDERYLMQRWNLILSVLNGFEQTRQEKKNNFILVITLCG